MYSFGPSFACYLLICSLRITALTKWYFFDFNEFSEETEGRQVAKTILL